MNQPTIYLISKRLSPDQLEKIQQLLSLTPLVGAVICDPRDADLAKQLCDTVSNLQRPIAIVADFEAPITALDSNGTPCPLL